MMMPEQHRTYVEEITQDIRVFESLLKRAKECVEEAEVWVKPEWLIEVAHCESRLTRFRDTLHIAEENFAPH
jgi:hypothetical protein